MSDGFEQWFNRQFDGPVSEHSTGNALATEIMSVCERHGVRLDDAVVLLETMLTMLKSLSWIFQCAKEQERAGIVDPGFSSELWSSIHRALMQFMKQRPERRPDE